MCNFVRMGTELLVLPTYYLNLKLNTLYTAEKITHDKLYILIG